MSNTIKTGINWTKLAIALALMCSMFSFGAIAQTKPEKPLNEEEVADLLDALKEGLPDLIDDEDAVEAISEKWDEREDLVGKTASQVLRLLFADVQAVIKDPATRTKIWKAWNPPSVATVPKPAATPGPAQNPQGLGQQEAFQLVSFLKMYVDDLFAANRVPYANIKWTDSNAFTGKTRAEIMRLLFADVQAEITDPASRKIIWDRWNRPAEPKFDETKAPQPIPQTPTGYLAVVITSNKNNQLVTENVPLLKWNVTVIDEQKRPVAGARVSIKLNFGETGNGIFQSIAGRSVADGIVQTAITNNAGTCSLSIPWTKNVKYDLMVTSAQGYPFKFGDTKPFDGPLLRGFEWGVKWNGSETLNVFTPEGVAKANAGERADKAAIAQLLLRPEDDWSRTGWTPGWANKAIEINNTFNDSVSDELRAKFTNTQKIVGALNILKLALTPASFDQLKQLYTFVQSRPRSNWNAVNLSCLSNPGLVPIADEFNALVKANISIEAGLIKDDYPLFPGTEVSKNDYGPPDARGWICSALVKNEMAKSMARDGLPPATINSAIGEQLEEEWPTITSANIGGKLEKASDQGALINWFSQKGLVIGQEPVKRKIGSVGRLSESEPKEPFRARVEAMLKSTVDPGSGRRLDDSLVIFRLKTLFGHDPARELTTWDVFLERGSVHLYDSYDNGADLSPEESLSGYISFAGKVRPGQPIPDKRDLAVAAYGWIIGAGEDADSSGPHLGLVVRRWVLFNINTGEIYGTSEANGDGKNYGQLFRLDH